MLILRQAKKLSFLLTLVFLTACGASNPTVGGYNHIEGKVSTRLELLSPMVKIGEWLTFRYSADKAGFVNIFAVNSSGRTTQLIQNKRVTGHATYSFPEKVDNFDVKVSGPKGVEHLVLVYSKQPFNPLLAGELKSSNVPSGLTLNSSQLLHRLQVSLTNLDVEQWARSDAKLEIY